MHKFNCSEFIRGVRLFVLHPDSILRKLPLTLDPSYYRMRRPTSLNSSPISRQEARFSEQHTLTLRCVRSSELPREYFEHRVLTLLDMRPHPSAEVWDLCVFACQLNISTVCRTGFT
jgi:hypothetical protein